MIKTMYGRQKFGSIVSTVMAAISVQHEDHYQTLRQMVIFNTWCHCGPIHGGMKKRVAIARSLAMNPDLILYDEPTAELDPVTSDELARVIMSLREKVNLTTIIVSHDLNFALYLSDRVAMMHEGEIIAIGTPAEIKKSQNPIVRNFLYTKTKGIQGEKE